jgi:hypothetical protein
MSIIGCDLHTRYQQIAMLEGEGGEVVTGRLETRERGSQSLLRSSAEALVDWDRGHGSHAVVRTDAGGAGSRAVCGACGGDSGAGGAATEDGYAGRGAPAGLAADQEIHDNGIGVSEKHLSDGRSLGILGMRERAWLLGGDLTINGIARKGTTVIARIPETHPTISQEGN